MGLYITRMDWPARTSQRWCDVNIKSILFLAVFAIGALYLWHNYAAHGGIAGVKQGVGLK